jgi:hypothetical protein
MGLAARQSMMERRPRQNRDMGHKSWEKVPDNYEREASAYAPVRRLI